MKIKKTILKPKFETRKIKIPKTTAAITESAIIHPISFFFENIFTNFLMSFSSIPILWYSFFSFLKVQVKPKVFFLLKGQYICQGYSVLIRF